MTIKLEPSWLAVLRPEFDKQYMKDLKSFLVEEQTSHRVYPPNSEIFSAFSHTPFERYALLFWDKIPTMVLERHTGLVSLLKGNPYTSIASKHLQRIAKRSGD